VGELKRLFLVLRRKKTFWEKKKTFWEKKELKGRV